MGRGHKVDGVSVGLIAIEGGGAHTGVLANTQCVCMVLQCVAHLFAPAAPLVAFVRAPTVSAATVVSTVVINSWLTHHRHDSLKTPGQLRVGRLALSSGSFRQGFRSLSSLATQTPVVHARHEPSAKLRVCSTRTGCWGFSKQHSAGPHHLVHLLN